MKDESSIHDINMAISDYNANRRRERRLRRRANKQGFELVNPWCADRRGIEGQGPYVLVPHGSGLGLDGVEEVLLRREGQQQH